MEKYVVMLVWKVEVFCVPQRRKKKKFLQKLIQAENHKFREIILLKEKLSLL